MHVNVRYFAQNFKSFNNRTPVYISQLLTDNKPVRPPVSQVVVSYLESFLLVTSGVLFRRNCLITHCPLKAGKTVLSFGRWGFFFICLIICLLYYFMKQKEGSGENWQGVNEQSYIIKGHRGQRLSKTHKLHWPTLSSPLVLK